MKSRTKSQLAFSLIELLVVVAIISVLSVVAVPVVGRLGGVTGAAGGAARVEQALDQARIEAISKKTYVYVALATFKDDNSTGTGIGKIAVCLVGSKDGGRITGSATSTNAMPIGRCPTARGVTLAPILAKEGNLARPTNAVVEWSGRPPAGPQISFPLGASAKYDFSGHPAVEFSPDGTARMAGDASVSPYIEIGLMPVRGDQVVAGDPNVAVVQLSGITGATSVYRP